ncbi:MAG: hypothetical protein FJ267_09480, partial [Planctomycetes bacterium]|nr:hypothetical protein [Planctomycetota bacterium]
MALVIGIDEAGLGPNLGPFVVATSVWNVPGNPSDVDLWSLFSEVVTNTNSRDDSRIHIADSKKVFRPGKGIKSLERGVHSALALADIPVASFRSLCTELAKPLRVSPPTERIRPTKSLRRTL